MKKIMKVLLILIWAICMIVLAACADKNRIADRENNTSQGTTFPTSKDVTTETSRPADNSNSDNTNNTDSKAITLLQPEGQTLHERVALPEGFERVVADEGSFADYLRNQPLKPDGSKVQYYDGGFKNREVHDAVLDVDVGDRDLQQCADAVIRLRAEYWYGLGEYGKIHYNFTNGFRTEYTKWMEGYRISVNGNVANWVKRAEYSNAYETFRKYLDMVFAYAGTISLAQELKAVLLKDMEPGDVFIQANPGHSVIVMDMAENQATGEKLFMLAQSYMPAQDIHILKNPQDKAISPWYRLNFGDTLVTPEWTFKNTDLMRFDE